MLPRSLSFSKIARATGGRCPFSWLIKKPPIRPFALRKPLENKDFQAKRHSAKEQFSSRETRTRLFAMVLVGAVALSPFVAQAKGFSLFGTTAQADTVDTTFGSADSAARNSQTISLPDRSIGPGSRGASKSSPTTTVTQGNALVAMIGPLGTAGDVDDMPDPTVGITFYTVRDGDTLAQVAQMFNVTPATILSANNLKAGSALKVGSILTILPMSGSEYTVKKGDTIKGIAQKYKVDPSDISFYNNLVDDSDLIAGDTIVIPNDAYAGDATGDSIPAKKKDSSKDTKSDSKKGKTDQKKPTKKNTTDTTPVATTDDGLVVGNNNGKNSTPITVHPMKDYDKTDLGTAILRPVSAAASRESQGAHGWNKTAVDLAAPLGTPIVAPYDGTITLARTGGYNGGYGNYVIMTSVVDGHVVQFIMGHMSKVIAEAGQTVSRGETIGLVGKTGDATGYHLHFEVRGAANPLVRNPGYTGE